MYEFLRDDSGEYPFIINKIFFWIVLFLKNTLVLG